MFKILILGGGFGGIRAALELEKNLKNSAEIILIDKNSFHLFVPAIYEVASSYGMLKDPFAMRLRKTVCIPYSDILEDKKIKFMQAEIAEVDLKNKKVKTKGEHVLEYDYLILALGSETSDYNIPGVKEYAHQFKTLDDAIFINKKFNELSSQFSSGQRTEPFSFLVCGAGFTGVELAAELSSCSNVIKKKCKMEGRCSTITLFEAGPKMMPMIGDQERNIVKKRLTNLGIIIMENSPIEEVGPNFIKLKNGQKLQGDLIIWTAGIKPNSFLNSIAGLPLSQSGKILIDNTLAVKGLQNIFAIGDNAELIDPKTQRPVPALAYVSADEAKIAAKNIYNLIKEKKLKPYKPSYANFIIPVGGEYALARVAGMTFKGIWGWLLRGAADLRYFMSILSIGKAIKLYWQEMTVFLKND